MTTSRPKRPIFRIVTPSFNQSQYLEHTIQSVLSQAGRGVDFDLQYAVIDGGSTDGSIEILRRYDTELDYWCSEPDRGQSHAINKGFDLVDGDLCAYINSDDYYLPGTFQQIVSLYHEHPLADLFHGVCHKVDAAGNFIGQQISDIESYSDVLDLWNHWLRPAGNRNFIQPEVFWTKRFSDRVGRFDESLHYTMDFDYWLRGLSMGFFVAKTSQPLAAFRIHADQKTSARHASIEELLDRVAGCLADPDSRLTEDHRQEMLRHLSMSRRALESADAVPERRLVSLLTLVGRQPALLRSPHYWRLIRRNSKRMVWKRGAA